MLIIRRSKLYCTASGIITLCRWPSGAQVKRGLNGLLVPDAVGTDNCAPDDGWRDRPKHVEQFTDKINCV